MAKACRGSPHGGSTTKKPTTTRSPTPRALQGKEF